MTTYYSRVDYPYSGGDKFFTITFPYINKEHIEVFINDVKTTNYTYLTESQISVSDSLSVQDIVSIRRNTPIDDRMVIFTETSLLKKDNQNLAQEQMFYAVQESDDNNEKFKIDLNDVIDDFKTEVNSSLQTQTTNINDFKSEINGQIADFVEISETIEADYANVQAATQTCIDNAATATTKANEAIASADALSDAVANVTANTNAIGVLSNLNTTNKNNLIDAINEVNTDITKQGNTFNGASQLVKTDEDGNIDIGAAKFIGDGSELTGITTDLSGLSDTNLSNLTTTGKTKVSNLAMPSNSYINITVAASGSSFTAPADGWAYIQGNITSGGSVKITNSTVGMESTSVVLAGFAPGRAYIPVKAGDIVYYYYNYTPDAFKFYYSEGSKP